MNELTDSKNTASEKRFARRTTFRETRNSAATSFLLILFGLTLWGVQLYHVSAEQARQTPSVESVPAMQAQIVRLSRENATLRSQLAVAEAAKNRSFHELKANDAQITKKLDKVIAVQKRQGGR